MIPPDQLDDLVLAIVACVGLVGTGVGALISWFIQTRKYACDADAQQVDAVLEWADQMRERLDKVEGRVDALEKDLSAAQRLIQAAAHFVDRIGGWIVDGMSGPRPTPPPVLEPHIDPTLWPRDDDE